MPKETTVPKSRDAVDNPRRQNAERRTERVACCGIEKPLGDQIIPIISANRVLRVFAVAQRSVCTHTSPADLIQRAPVPRQFIEWTVRLPQTHLHVHDCAALTRGGMARRLSTGAAARSLLMWLSTTVPSGWRPLK